MKKKKALIIGGGSDIGADIVKVLHKEGYDVTWTYCKTKRILPGNFSRCDLTEPRQIHALFDQIEDLDLLVTASFPFLEGDGLDYSDYLKVSTFLDGHMCVFTQAAKKMVKGGKIINLLGQCVERGLPTAPFYSAAFAYICNWGHSINAVHGKAGELAVLNLLLGPVNTRMWAHTSPESLEMYKGKVQAFIDPEEVAETVVFFAGKKTMPSTFKWDAYYGY